MSDTVLGSTDVTTYKTQPQQDVFCPVMNMGVEQITGVQNKDGGNRECSKYQEKTKDGEPNGAQGTQNKAQEVSSYGVRKEKHCFLRDMHRGEDSRSRE